MITSLLLLAAVAVQDPRIALADLRLEGQPAAALHLVEETLEQSPDFARTNGFDLARGDLLEQLDRLEEADRSFIAAIDLGSGLADYGRFRHALNLAARGAHEEAAIALAEILRTDPPARIASRAAAALAEAVSLGGDCTTLAVAETADLPSRSLRPLRLARADCAASPKLAEAALAALLAESQSDEIAYRAALRLDSAPELAVSSAERLSHVGLAFYHRRDFDRATSYLERALDGNPALSQQERLAAHYALARAYFWLERYESAADSFAALVDLEPKPAMRARAAYQQGRSLELAGRWEEATTTYRRSYRLDPRGRWADAALISALRDAWRGGHESSALTLYETLARGPRRQLRLRAGLFLAASDLVRGRTDKRTQNWLRDATAAARGRSAEVTYWRARFAELADEPKLAVERYLAVLREDPVHPLALDARRRLHAPALADATEAHARQSSAAGRLSDLYDAWLLLAADAEGGSALASLERALRNHAASRAFLDLDRVQTASWPLWNNRLRDPPDRLMALGIWSQSGSTMARHFPLSDLRLAFTRASLHAAAGEPHRALYVAEVLSRKIPKELAFSLLPTGYRQLLYPWPHRETIEREAARRDIDPYLVTAIIREESRFNADAISPASAHGLTQFVLPTAREVATDLGIDGIDTRDLHDPGVAIALGAAYLSRLHHSLDGRIGRMVAAYNAGEPQARLWQTYCYTGESAEYFTKVGFPETRSYLRRVLSSRERYTALYDATQGRRADQSAP